MFSSYEFREDATFRCPLPSGIVLEAGAFREELSIADAAVLLGSLADDAHDEKLAFYEKAAAHPAFSIRKSAAKHLAGSPRLGSLLLDRASAVREAARDELEAHPQRLPETLLQEIKEKFPSLFASLPEECLGSKTTKRANRRRSPSRPTLASASKSQDIQAASPRLIYQNAFCPLTEQDLLEMADDWEPLMVKKTARFFEALAALPPSQTSDDEAPSPHGSVSSCSTSIWQSTKFRASLAQRLDISRAMTLRLRDDPDDSVFEKLINNIAAWKHFTFKEKLALIKGDPKLIERFFIFSRSEKEIRRMAALLQDDPDPEIRMLCAMKRKNPKKVARDRLWDIR